MRCSSQLIKRVLDLADSRDLINFYSDPSQRRRGVTALDLCKVPTGLVLAAPRPDIGFFSGELRCAGVPIAGIHFVEVTPDWHRVITQVLDACLHLQQKYRAARLLADFGGEVHYGAIYQLESLLRSATREWGVRCTTQYDARKFSEAIDVDALSRLGTVLFGHYYRIADEPRRDSRREKSADETVNLSHGDD